MLKLYPFNITVAFVKDITHIEYRNLIVVYKFINKISIDTMKQLKILATYCKKTYSYEIKHKPLISFSIATTTSGVGIVAKP